MRKQIRFKLLLVITLLFLTSCSYAQNDKNVKDPSKSTKTESNIDNLLRKQILLTNRAQFTSSRNLTGASGFLIKYQGTNFAVTARHLLGEAGGIQPEVEINNLEKNLLNWEMLPRVVSNAAKETVKLNVKGLDFSDLINDIVLLKITSDTFDLGILTPNFDVPMVGETLFLVGCPYSERQCKQNSYQVTFVEFVDSKSFLACEIKSDVNLAGFSGAPLVNEKGEVVGVLSGSIEIKGKNYILATHIKEIQKIKF
jgi:S1-C subfamily serine protease